MHTPVAVINEIAGMGGALSMNSLSLDGSTEAIIDIDSGANLLGATNLSVGTAAIWIKVVNSTTGDYFFDLAGAAGSNVNRVALNVEGSNTSRIKFRVWRNTGQVAKNYDYDNAITEDVWTHYAMRWNAAGDEADLFINGVLITPDTLNDDLTFNMDATDHDRLYIGRDKNGGDYLEAIHHSAAIWERFLTDEEVLEMYNSGNAVNFDLSVDGTDYSSSDLLHWWDWGRTESDLFHDFSGAASVMDFGDSENITSADIVMDYPGA